MTPGGFVIVATFGPEGPEMCSGLEVVRYDEGHTSPVLESFGPKVTEACLRVAERF